MSRPAVEVADILRAQGNRFLGGYEKSFDFQQLKAFRAIERCRTVAWKLSIPISSVCAYSSRALYTAAARDRLRSEPWL